MVKKQGPCFPLVPPPLPPAPPQLQPAPEPMEKLLPILPGPLGPQPPASPQGPSAQPATRSSPVILLHPTMALVVADTTTTTGPTLYHHQWGVLNPVASNHLSHRPSHCPGSSVNHHELLQFEGDCRSTGGLEMDLSSRTSSAEEDISNGKGMPYSTR